MKWFKRAVLIAAMANFASCIWFSQYIISGWLIYLYVVGSWALLMFAVVWAE